MSVIQWFGVRDDASCTLLAFQAVKEIAPVLPELRSLMLSFVSETRESYKLVADVRQGEIFILREAVLTSLLQFPMTIETKLFYANRRRGMLGSMETAVTLYALGLQVGKDRYVFEMHKSGGLSFVRENGALLY